MAYRTKRPNVRKLLAFGVGTTLAITQLGAGCVPPGDDVPVDENDSGADDGATDADDAGETE